MAPTPGALARKARDLAQIPFRLESRRIGFSSLSKQQASRTPPDLANWLVTIARLTWFSMPQKISQRLPEVEGVAHGTVAERRDTKTRKAVGNEISSKRPRLEGADNTVER
jgi:hypothetical protein